MDKRKVKKYHLSPTDDFIRKSISWGMREDYLAYLNSNSISYPSDPYSNTLAIGAVDLIKADKNAFVKLEKFYQKHKDWMFGYLAYDLKNEIENLESNNTSTFETPNLCFFIPETILFFRADHVLIESFQAPDKIFEHINQTIISEPRNHPSGVKFKSRVGKQEYMRNVDRIKQSIVEGDFYELNYCIEYYCNKISIDPASLYSRLNLLSPMPFSTFFKLHKQYIIGASPERFLCKRDLNLISQPIKGTMKRGRNSKEDDFLKASLKNSEKERAENLMIVDLVRNDLARSSVPGTIKVVELFGVYTFKQVHQMISTVKSKARSDVTPFQIIKNAFPMGSMTGAPKIRVMEEIDSIEASRRGIYSGASGYFTPSGDFDLNVIIRTLIYDSMHKTLSFHVGSAITHDSNAEYEFNECMLKATAMFSILQDPIGNHF